MSVAVIIPAAGSGRRLGAKVPKAFVPLGNRPLIIHTLSPFLVLDDITEVVIALPAGSEAAFRELKAKYDLPDKVRHVRGGSQRQDSVQCAFDALHPDDMEVVLIHDAARPFVTATTIRGVISRAARFGAAIAAIPLTDTLKRVSSEQVTVETIDRSGLYRAQTPQGFQYPILRKALEAARHDGFYGTDTASLAEKAGFPVCIACGHEMNFKITTEADLSFAESLLKSYVS